MNVIKPISLSNRDFMQLKRSTLFLKTTVIIMGLVVLIVCVTVLPPIIRSEIAGDFDYGPILLGMYIAAIPFFIALYQMLKLLRFIDSNSAFSDLSVVALRRIKHCAITISVLYAAGMPYIYYVANRDDAPGIIALGCVIVFASAGIATFAAVLQKLLQDALDIKSENDLTI